MAPLVDITTNLKSLKFGRDRFGGGSSNQPYIKSPIPEKDQPGIISSGGPDFALRGGLLAPIRAGEDVVRISKMLFDPKSPQGLLFIAKQNTLSRLNVKTESSKGPGYAGGALNQGVYLPTSTIIQAGVGFTGTHTNLLGLNPFTPVIGGDRTAGGLERYDTVVKNQDVKDNRLLNLTQEHINPDLEGINSDNYSSTSQFEIGGALRRKRGNPTIFTYKGGPGSILGIGKTGIRFADDARTGNQSDIASSDPKFFYLGGRPRPLVLRDINKLRFNVIDPLSFELSRELFEEETDSVISSRITLSPSKTNEKAKEEDIQKAIRPVIENKDVDVLKLSPFLSNNTQVNEDINVIKNRIILSPSETKEEEGGEIILNGIRPPLGASILSNASKFIALKPPSLEEIGIKKKSIKTGDTRTVSYLDTTQSPSRPTIQTVKAFKKENRSKLSDNIIGNNINNSETYVGLKKGYLEKETRGYRYNTSNLGGYKDLINKLDLTSFSTPTNGFTEYKDFIQFKIAILDNDLKDTTSTYLHFRAFIDNFSDSYTGNWGEVQYVGRGNKFYNYEGFSRQISLGFTVHASSFGEMENMYNKLNYLASSLAPDYSEAGYMRGNLIRLTVGNYINEQYGILQNLSYEVIEESPWDIGRTEEEDLFLKTIYPNLKFPDRLQLPHLIKITSFQFTPIHNFIEEKAKSNQRYIAMENNYGLKFEEKRINETLPEPISSSPTTPLSEEEILENKNTISPSPPYSTQEKLNSGIAELKILQEERIAAGDLNGAAEYGAFIQNIPAIDATNVNYSNQGGFNFLEGKIKDNPDQQALLQQGIDSWERENNPDQPLDVGGGNFATP